MNAKIAVIIALSAALCACGAGSGEGLDDNGIPLELAEQENQIPDETEQEEEDTPVENGVTLAELQTDIFGAICAQCHVGSSAPQGLRLDSEENSFNFLVGQNANEVPSLQRVNPGDPDASYMVHKIEGRSTIIGSQMPLGQSPLSDADIQRIRDWIANGAPREGSGSASTKISNVVSTKHQNHVEVNMHFSRALNANTFNKNDLLIQFTYEDYVLFANEDEFHYELDGQQLKIQINQQSHPHANSIDLTINSPITSAIEDIDGRIIDADADALDGGEQRYVIQL